MRTAMLGGRDHARIGSIATIAEERVAIAISRGGAAKQYAYKHPNEDAVAFAEADAGLLLAIADGHAGCEASESAVERTIAQHAPRWLSAATPADWQAEASATLLDLQAEIIDLLGRGHHEGARTTFAVVVARPADDWLSWITMGDSLAYRATSSSIEPLGAADESFFLGYAAEDAESLSGKFQAGTRSLADTWALVLATDGLSETGIGVADPPAAVAAALARAKTSPTDMRPLAAARGLAEIAMEAHLRQNAGDNVATAVAWLA